MRDTWQDIKTVLLYEAGFSLSEVSRFCGITKQGVQQRLARLGCERRRPGQPRGSTTIKYPPWQRQLMDRLREAGLSDAEVADLLSLDSRSPLRSRRQSAQYRRPAGGFRTRIASTVWIERRNLILAAARLDGATHKEIADLAGWNKPEESVTTLKRRFPQMPNAVALHRLLKLAKERK